MNTPNSYIVSAYMYKRRRTRPIITFTEGVSTRLYKYIIISRVQSKRKTLIRNTRAQKHNTQRTTRARVDQNAISC